MRRLVLVAVVVLAASAVAACNRIIDLTPVTDARAPDAHTGGGDGSDGGNGGDGGIGDAGIGDGGALPDAFVSD